MKMEENLVAVCLTASKARTGMIPRTHISCLKKTRDRLDIKEEEEGLFAKREALAVSEASDARDEEKG